jgi:preprotein translocase subunit YajC
MNEIKVGDRVRTTWGEEGIVLGIHTNSSGERWLWTEFDKSHQCWGFTDEHLTLISPEPVTLTVGQKVRLSEGRVGIIKDLREEAYVEIDDSRETTVHWPPLRIWKLSSELEPVPSPCPECKGSGKSEGSA